MSSMQRSCVFCPGEAKMSGEHLWSDWIGDALGPRRYIFSQETAPQTIAKRWQSNSLDLTAKVVCKQCNEGWMSNLESQHAKPAMEHLIRYGSPLSLLRTGIASIAAFAFKSTIIAYYMRRTGPKTLFPLAVRRRFAASLTIPDGVQMWLSSLAKREGRTTGIFQGHTFKTPHGTVNGFELYVFTFGAGHLVIQVAVSRWTKNFLRRNSFPRITKNPYWDNLATPFWPSNGTPVLWPPPKHLSDEMIDTFCCRWRNVTVPATPFRAIRIR